MTFDLNSGLDLVTAALALTAAVLGLVNRRKIHDVHVDLNSRLSQLVEAEHARGVSEGASAERAAHDAGATAEAT
jgi:hypothetical protein